jgi:hypothetical protein
MIKMKDHVALLEKEIRELEINLERAKKKPGVQEQELNCLNKKLELKRDILTLVKISTDSVKI